MSRILVVEDSPTQAKEIAHFLEEEGFEVALARDARQALAILADARIDAVISDILMPGLSGFELCHQIKQNPDYQHLPVILLTKLTEPKDIIQGLECEADNFITKSFEAKKLLECVRTVLENRDRHLAGDDESSTEIAYDGKRLKITSNRGQILNLLIATSENIARTNQELQKSQNDLRAAHVKIDRYAQMLEGRVQSSEEKYRRLMEQANDAILLLDPAGKVLEVNQRTVEIMALAAEQMIGQCIDHLIAFGQELAWPDILARIQREERSNDFETALVQTGLSPRYLSMSLSGIKDQHGQIVGIMVIARDMTERIRAEEMLRQADRRKDEFLATLAHELRNPLAPIRNSLHILKTLRVDAATAERTREIMERQVHHLVRLVDDLLDVSRVMRGKIELRKERVELSALVARAVETAQPLLDAHGQSLRISLPTESLPLNVDPIRMAQVINNLLTNASKYTEPGGQLGLTGEKDGNQMVLRVRDNGIGIATEMLSRIFELFVQVDHAATRAQGGLGIGLTLVKNLVEMHQGTVTAQSDGLQRGSEFVVRLPLAESVTGTQAEDAGEGAASKEKTVLPDPVPLADDTVLEHCRILVVDDNVDAANSLVMLLQLHGHTVEVAHRGRAALELFRSYRPEVVFLDIGMPEMDGNEVARRLRQQPGQEHVLLVALTGWGTPEDRRRSAAAGFDHHLVKPVEPQVLKELLMDLKSRRMKSGSTEK